MSPTQSLVSFFLISQLGAAILLIIAYAFNFETFKLVAEGRLAIIPSLPKAARLFGLSKKPVFQIIYFFSAVFTLFSYIAFVLLLVYTIGWFFGLL